MNHSRTDVVVGIFVLGGVICLGYLAIRLGKLELFGNAGYLVYADFASVAGLKLGDPVEIAGVKVGKVESLALADDRARIAVRLEPQVKLQEDAIASVRARGLIGDKFVLVGPPHRQLPILQTDIHCQRPRRGLTLKPIDAWFRR